MVIKFVKTKAEVKQDLINVGLSVAFAHYDSKTKGTRTNFMRWCPSHLKLRWGMMLSGRAGFIARISYS